MVRVVDTWHVAGLGPVSVAISDRARYLRITLKRDGTITLTVPRGIPLEQARRFLESKHGWIRRHRRSSRAPNALPVAGRAAARALLTERVRELADAHGFTYNKVFVKNQSTLWGSCSVRNNINLNVHLLRLPAELRDYVVLHELVHTRHKNHSPDFWREMNRLVGDGKRLQRQLRTFRLGT